MGKRTLEGLGWVAIFVLELCGLFAEPARAATLSPRIPTVYSGGRTPLPQISGSLPPSLPALQLR
jgi:hypothetical protein